MSKRKNDKYQDDYKDIKSRRQFQKNKIVAKTNKWMDKAIKTKDITDLIHIIEDDNANL